MNSLINLYSATCLIKKETLEELNMKFPDSCLEDVWMEQFSTKNYWAGLINPFTVSLQSFDTNIFQTIKRYFRIDDWTVKYFKENFFKKQNETKSKTYYELFYWNAFSHILIWLKLILFSILTFLLINYWNVIINNNYYLLIIILILPLFFVRQIIKILNISYVTNFKNIIPFYLLQTVYNFTYNILSSINFLKAFFGSKYSSFETSRGGQINFKNNYLLMFIINLIIFIIFEFFFIFFEIYKINLYLMFTFIFLNTLFISILMSFFFLYFLYWISFIKTNKKYDPNNFIYNNK